MLPFRECSLCLISSAAVKHYTPLVNSRGLKAELIIFRTLFHLLFGKSNFVKSEPSVKAFNDTSFWKISI